MDGSRNGLMGGVYLGVYDSCHLGSRVPWFSLETVESPEVCGALPVKPPDQVKSLILVLWHC